MRAQSAERAEAARRSDEARGVTLATFPEGARHILAAWVAIGFCLVGVGAFARRLLGRRAASADDWLEGFWIGFASVLAALQLWQLCFPIDQRIVFVVACTGVLGVLVEGTAPWRLVAHGLRRHAIAVTGLTVATAWFALQALGGPRNGDSGLYHVPTITWHLAHRLPPGLGNLAAPFAYNQSFFLWAALLERGPLPGRGTHVGNTLLVVALLARVCLGLSRLVRRRRCTPADAVYGALLPGVLLVGRDINLTSPSPDIAVYTLGIVLAVEFLRFLTEGRRFADLAALAVLVACAPPLKLSLGGLAATTAIVAGIAWLRSSPHGTGIGRAAAVLGAIALVGPGVWMLRGVVVSGYPLYPATLFGTGVDWAVPYDTVVAEAKLIRYWNGVEGWWTMLWRDPGWLVRWLPTLDWLRADVLVPLGIAAAALLAGGVQTAMRPRSARALPAIVVLPTLGSIAYCIAAAPRARYGASAYWVLAVESLWLALPASVLEAGHTRARRIVAVLALVLAAVFLQRADGLPLVPELRDFEPHVRGTATPYTLPSGLVVNDPGPGMQCWEAALPCSPFHNDALRLRRPDDLASGFTVAPMR